VTNARAAQAAGLTGQGVRIGIVDSGVQRNAAALNGRVLANLNYIDPARNNLRWTTWSGHGTAVASLAAGAPVGTWPGGIAPGAQIVSARIIADKPPVDDGSGKGNSFSGPLGVAQVHQDLISYNVKVMNNSWGGLYWTDLPTTAQVAAEYRPFVINHGGLVVFAAGNDARSEPSSLAALPSQQGVAGTLPAADLERGWLVATAVDPYAPGTLASYANACGRRPATAWRRRAARSIPMPTVAATTGTTARPSPRRWSPARPRWSGSASRTSTTTWCGRPCWARPRTSARPAWMRCSATACSTSAGDQRPGPLRLG
jgi:hypothetical protein